VIALDLDSQASLVRWSERRKTANVANRVVIEPLETEWLPQIPVILEGLAGIGFTVALFDTADADAEGVRRVIDSVDLCLVPARPTPLDVDAAAATFRSVFLANRRAAFVLNQCPSTQPAREGSGERANAPWRSRRAKAGRALGFSRCGCRWFRSH
jgi:chromosome partitioning protein